MLNIKFNRAPILLLDDIVEHLDEKHRVALYHEVTRHSAQSWFTSTSKDAFNKYPNTIDKIYLPHHHNQDLLLHTLLQKVYQAHHLHTI